MGVRVCAAHCVCKFSQIWPCPCLLDRAYLRGLTHAGAERPGRGSRLSHHAARMAGGMGGEESRRAAARLQRALLAQVQVRHYAIIGQASDRANGLQTCQRTFDCRLPSPLPQHTYSTASCSTGSRAQASHDKVPCLPTCRFYFAYCEAAFDAKYIHNYQILWIKDPAAAPPAAPAPAFATANGSGAIISSNPVTQVHH